MTFYEGGPKLGYRLGLPIYVHYESVIKTNILIMTIIKQIVYVTCLCKNMNNSRIIILGDLKYLVIKTRNVHIEI